MDDRIEQARYEVRSLPDVDPYLFLTYFCERFGLAWMAADRDQAESEIGRRLTDDEWERLQGTKAWGEQCHTWLGQENYSLRDALLDVPEGDIDLDAPCPTCGVQRCDAECV